MKKVTLALSLMLVFAFVISLARPSFAQEEQMEQVEQQKEKMMEKKEMMKETMGKKETVEGDIICVEADEQGNLRAVEKTECAGIFVVVGKDGKLYTLYGSEEKMKKMSMVAKEKKVIGEVGGNQRGWILYASPLEKGQKPVEKTVTGNIICLLPDYNKGTVNPVVANGPCNEAVPHAHVVYTKDGQIYALEGSEEAIHKMEMNPQRKDVTVKGKLQGNPGAWVLFVE